MDRWVGKTAVVTGASSGIGAATAVALANQGLRVIGIARRPHLVDKLQGEVTGKGSIFSRLCDVSKPDDIAETFQWIEDEFGGVDVVINNAALFSPGHITEAGSDPLTEQEIIAGLDVNIRGVVLCARHAVASMTKRGARGHVININSIAGHYVPFSDIFNVYSSTKYALTAFTQALSSELAHFKSHIKTTSISPGLVATDLTKNSRISVLDEAVAAQAPFLLGKDVAEAIVYVLSTPPHVNISELTIQPVGEKRL